MVENTPAARICSHPSAEPDTSVRASSLVLLLLCVCVIWILNNPHPPRTTMEDQSPGLIGNYILPPFFSQFHRNAGGGGGGTFNPAWSSQCGRK